MNRANKTISRLRRVLDLASFLMSKPGVSVEEAAEHLGAAPEEILDDLDLLFLCGLPPYTPTDLFEVFVDGETIWLTGAEPLEKPFGISRYEAIRSVAAARLALGLPGAETAPELSDAAAKVEVALGEEPLIVDDEPDDLVRELREALAAGKAIEICYLSAARGEEAARVVDPSRLVTAWGRVYLFAWCRQAGGMRSFRADRIKTVTVLDEPARPAHGEISLGYRAAPDDLRVTLEIGPEAAWVTHSVPLEAVEVLDDGAYRIVVASPDREFLVRLTLQLGGRLRSVDPAWLRREVASRAEALRRLQASAGKLVGNPEGSS